MEDGGGVFRQDNVNGIQEMIRPSRNSLAQAWEDQNAFGHPAKGFGGSRGCKVAKGRD